MNRREFLQRLGSFSSLPLAVPALLQERTGDDALICNQKFELALRKKLYLRPINEVIVEIGRSFLGTPYVAGALEVPGEERLVVNLRGLDCVSFCENALVLARCVKMQKTSFEQYRAELQRIRYRDGKIDRYPSRLHYFTDWIYDNEKKAVLKNVTKEIGGVLYRKKIQFMSTHIESYRQLREKPEFVEVMKRQEATISARDHFFIPKENLRFIEEKIEDGDILAITTTTEGLDVSHTGIALQQHGRLYMMHAPDVGLRVRITELPLVEHLAANKSQSGVIVARALEPEG